MSDPDMDDLKMRGLYKSNIMEQLMEEEHLWRDAYEHLLERGYMLRDRYKPGWVPSWHGKKGQTWRTSVDGPAILDLRIGDAIRLSDGAVVAIKVYDTKNNPNERDVALKFNAPPLADDPRNHCMPVYEIFPLPSRPGALFIVAPLLRVYDDPPFETIGEVVAFWEQMFEGLHFMHLNKVVHRDCTNNNMMLDPSDMYPASFHPAEPAMRRDYKGKAKYYSRTQRPPRYYLIDYGLTIDFSLKDGPPQAYPNPGGDKTVPEFRDHPGEYHDPFPTDVYYLGNWIRKHFMQKYEGFDFMQALVGEMTRREPTERPTMEETLRASSTS